MMRDDDPLVFEMEAVTPLERNGIQMILEVIPDHFRNVPSIKAGIDYLAKMVYSFYKEPKVN